jgi:hypothetical protein
VSFRLWSLYTLEEESVSTHWSGGWLGPVTGLEAMARRNISVGSRALIVQLGAFIMTGITQPGSTFSAMFLAGVEATAHPSLHLACYRTCLEDVNDLNACAYCVCICAVV